MSSMQEALQELKETFEVECQSAATPKVVEDLRVKYLGRKSTLTSLFAKIPSLDHREKGEWGKKLNACKNNFAQALSEKEATLRSTTSAFDLTFPPTTLSIGSRHVLASVSEKICSIFEQLGFAVIEGNEIEDEWHNFEALNFPSDHPSRDSFDTFYVDLPAHKGGKHLLRCHTSPSQIRLMQQYEPPLAVISPGRVYRPDEVDASHSFMFHQIEGFAVSEEINFAHLKGVLLVFAREFFSPDVHLRFRPHFFPFTEPSAEVDVSCIICQGAGEKQALQDENRKCSVCKGKGWLEVLGCGMIHPNVLTACGINAKKYKGFAFGMGVDRMAMLKYGIDDIRLFYENDVRFLQQFNL